jgi:hypothetical protein
MIKNWDHQDFLYTSRHARNEIIITYQYQARVFVFLSRVLGGRCKLPILTPTHIQGNSSFTADGKIGEIIISFSYFADLIYYS